MKRRKSTSKMETRFIDEEEAWIRLTPEKRLLETTRLWKLYIALGGSLDIEPDPQSPFDFQKI